MLYMHYSKSFKADAIRNICFTAVVSIKICEITEKADFFCYSRRYPQYLLIHIFSFNAKLYTLN
jgi:hypothetical protein